MKILSVFAALALAAACVPLHAEAPLPAHSIYQLGLSLTDQDGRTAPLAALRGEPTIITMFYTSCQFVCPMIADTIRMTENAMSPAERARLRVVMVSFDPAHDTVAVLHDTALRRSIDIPRWSLARTDAASVRKLAAVLGVQYRPLPNGEFNHSTTIIVLDADGRIAARTSELGSVDAALVTALHKVAAR
jgi:protein SCO1/2